jgi:hypothetical protein
VIAADMAAAVVINEDLGSGPTLESVLLARDPSAARAAMIALGRAAGRLHRMTVDSRHERQSLLAPFGLGNGDDEVLGEWPGGERWERIEASSRDLGFPDAREAGADVIDLVSRLREPGPFVSLTHQDLNPTNVLVTSGGIRLVDLEGSRFGHLGFDTCHLFFPFPFYSAHWATLPTDVTAEVLDAYLEELRQENQFPADRFDEMLAIGAALALVVRLHRLPKLADDSHPAHDRWRRRAQMVQQIQMFADLARRVELLESLAGWSRRLADAMASRWSDATHPAPPLFPAFEA